MFSKNSNQLAAAAVSGFALRGAEDTSIQSMVEAATSELATETPANMIEWVYSGKDKKSSLILYAPYVDARFVIRQLNQSFGVLWSKAVKVVHLNNGSYFFHTEISVNFGNLVIKRDGVAEDTDIGKYKGGESASFKRAATGFGIGLDLYDYPRVLVMENGYAPMNKLMPLFNLIVEEVKKKNLLPDDEITIVSNGSGSYIAYLTTGFTEMKTPNFGELIEPDKTYKRVGPPAPSKPKPQVQQQQQQPSQTVATTTPATSPKEFITKALNDGKVLNLPSYDTDKKMRMDIVTKVKKKTIYNMAGVLFIISRDEANTAVAVKITEKDSEWLSKNQYTLENI